MNKDLEKIILAVQIVLTAVLIWNTVTNEASLVRKFFS